MKLVFLLISYNINKTFGIAYQTSKYLLLRFTIQIIEQNLVFELHLLNFYYLQK